MASRESVHERVRKTLTDELVALIRRCGLLVHVTLATLVYKYLLKECLPGQYALTTLLGLYGVGVIKLIPGETSLRGFAKWFAIAGRLLETHTADSNMIHTSSVGGHGSRSRAIGAATKHG